MLRHFSAGVHVSVAGVAGLLGTALLAGCAGVSSGGGGSASGTPAATFSVSSLAFGTVGLGVTTLPQTVTVTNSGTASLAISSATVSGDFALASNACGASLSSGASCAMMVTFTPTVVGARTGTLSLATNASGSPQSLALTGAGGVSGSTLSSGALAFGSVNLGSSSAAQTLTISNGGTAPLALSGTSLAAGDFSQVSTTCTASVAVGASCQVVLLFTPTATGPRTSTLTIKSNVTASPQTVALSGTGLPAVVYTGLPISAKVLAGTTPIAGASVQFYAAGATGSRIVGDGPAGEGVDDGCDWFGEPGRV